MGTENQNGDILSSWKEIAAYLKCGVRSCIRWETERVLPVHRMADAPGSRVYAYKHELDAWLAAQLNPDDEVARERSAAPKPRRIVAPVALALLALAVVAAAFLVLRGRISREAFRLEDGSVVTTEPDGPGRLHVWRAERSGAFKSIWAITTSKTNTVHHTTVTTGDFDGDGRAELAAPAFAKTTFTRGEKQAVYFKIFINLYKQGKKGIWKTTYFSDAECVWEDRSYWPNQIVAANVDEHPASEILLKTATTLAVYRYDRVRGELTMTDVIPNFEDQGNAALAAVAAANGNHTAPDRILVSANVPRPGQPPTFDNGRLYYVELTRKGPSIVRSVSIDAQLTSMALRVGDVDHDGSWEVYATAFRAEGKKFQPYLIGWNVYGEKTVDIPLPGSDPDTMPVVTPLTIADLTFDAGDDILTAIQPDTLLLYSWKDGKLALVKSFSPATPNVVVSTLAIGSGGAGEPKTVIVGGLARPGNPESGSFYLEMLDFRPLTMEFISKAKRVGGKKGEMEVWSALLPQK